MEKTKTRKTQETLEAQGVSSKTARQAAVTITADSFFKERTERGGNQVMKAWVESVLNGMDE